MGPRPRMDQPAEYADLLAMMRAHIARDEPALQALLVQTRIDPYAVLAMLAGHAESLGAQVLGSVEAYDEWLAAEQARLGLR